jgi:predicted metal-dependent peptidase
MKQLNDILSAAIWTLVHKERFFAEVIMQCQRHYDYNLPAIAGVSIEKGSVNLFINPTLWAECDLNLQVDVLKHECFHIMNGHINRRPELKEHKLWNIATDAAINEFLPVIKADGRFVVVDSIKQQIPSLENLQQSEYYYRMFKDTRDQNQKGDKGKGKGEGDGNEFGELVDDHGTWERTDCSPEAAKQIVRKALNEAAGKAAGSVPSEAQIAIAKLNTATVNWRSYVRRFVSNSTESVKRSSRMTRNRRYGIQIPGFRRKPTSRIAIAVDSSGSVSDKAFSQFFSEVTAIHKLGGIEITIIEADCVVEKVYTFDPKKPIVRNSAGGTAYQPAIDRAVELGVDALIYFGDGDCADQPIQPRIPFLWALTTDRKPVEWGY